MGGLAGWPKTEVVVSGAAGAGVGVMAGAAVLITSVRLERPRVVLAVAGAGVVVVGYAGGGWPNMEQKAQAEAHCQWEALHGSQTHLSVHYASPGPPIMHHSILHHQPPSAGEQPYDTLSLESSDSMDTSISTGNNSACSPDNMSR